MVFQLIVFEFNMLSMQYGSQSECKTDFNYLSYPVTDFSEVREQGLW